LIGGECIALQTQESQKPQEWFGEMDLGCETWGVKRCLADCDMGRGFGVLGFGCVGDGLRGRWVGGWWRCKKREGGGGG